MISPVEQRRLLARDVGGILSADDVWTGTIHVTSNVTVAAGTELTIDPGTVIKFDSGRYLDVNGSIVARGTATDKITFTSVQHDAVGEDLTTGEGVPAAGDWESLLLNNGDAGVTLEHVNVHYAGDGNSFGVAAIQLGKESTSLDVVVVRDSLGDGVAVAGDPSLDRVTSIRTRNAFTQALAADPTY